MNNYLRAAGVLAVALCAVNAQAYKFTVVNNTNEAHRISIRLQGFLGLGEEIIPLNDSKPIKDGGVAEVSYPFGHARAGQCIKEIRVDNQIAQLLKVTPNQLQQIKQYQDNIKQLDAYLAARGIYEQRPQGLLDFCGDLTFYVMQIGNRLVAITVEKGIGFMRPAAF
jgi:hypothetical protein